MVTIEKNDWGDEKRLMWWFFKNDCIWSLLTTLYFSSLKKLLEACSVHKINIR